MTFHLTNRGSIFGYILIIDGVVNRESGRLALIPGSFYYSKCNVESQPFGSLGIKQELCAILIFNMEGFNLVPVNLLIEWNRFGRGGVVHRECRCHYTQIHAVI